MAEQQVFLSYALPDVVAARPVVRAIEARGWPISWERYPEPGEIPSKALYQAEAAADCVVVLWSRRSVDEESIIAEARRARKRGVLVQVATDDATVPLPFVLDQPLVLKESSGLDDVLEAVASVLGVSKKRPSELEASTLEIAEARARAGDVAGAVTIYQRWVEATPGDMKAARRLGELLVAFDRFPEAARVFAIVAERYASSGFVSLAVDCYREVTKLEPSAENYRKRLDALIVEQEMLSTGSRRAISSVHFTITAPAYVKAGEAFVVDVWAHRDQDREKVVRRQVDWEEAERAEGHPMLTARLHIDGLDIPNATQSLRWSRGLGIVSFPVLAASTLAKGGRTGVMNIYFLGLQIARIHFSVQVDEVTSPPEVIPSRQERHTRAIATFAAQDRAAVEARVRAFESAAPGIDVFMEPLETRSGFLETLSSRDVLYLFWSQHASASRDVEREWRYALRLRGIDFIDPVPLVSSKVAALPDELASFPGGDWKVAPETAAAFDPFSRVDRQPRRS